MWVPHSHDSVEDGQRVCGCLTARVVWRMGRGYVGARRLTPTAEWRRAARRRGRPPHREGRAAPRTPAVFGKGNAPYLEINGTCGDGVGSGAVYGKGDMRQGLQT